MAHAEFNASFTEFPTTPGIFSAKSRLDKSDRETIDALADQLVDQAQIEDAYGYFSLLTLHRATDMQCLPPSALIHKLPQAYETAVDVYSFLNKLAPTAPQEPAVRRNRCGAGSSKKAIFRGKRRSQVLKPALLSRAYDAA